MQLISAGGGISSVNLVFVPDEIKHEQMGNPRYAQLVPCCIHSMEYTNVSKASVMVELTRPQSEHETEGEY